MKTIPGQPMTNEVESERENAYSVDRTVLANERTYAAWIRTGLTALAAGIAIEKFMLEIMPSWTIRTIAAALIVFSAVAFLVAGWRYTHLGLKMVNVDVKSIPVAVTTGAAVLLVLCSLLALLGLWLVNSGPGI